MTIDRIKISQAASDNTHYDSTKPETGHEALAYFAFITGANWALSQTSIDYNSAIDEAKSIVESNFSTKDSGTQATEEDSQLLLQQILDFLEKAKK